MQSQLYTELQLPPPRRSSHRSQRRESLLNRGYGKPQKDVAVAVDDVQRGREVTAVLEALRQGAGTA